MLASRTATRISASIVGWNAMLEKRALIARAAELCRSTSSVAMVVAGPGAFDSSPQAIQKFSKTEGKDKFTPPGNEMREVAL